LDRFGARRVSALSQLALWRHPDLAGRLERYRAVADGRLPAKYRIAARIPAGVSLAAPEPELDEALAAGTAAFLARRARILAGESLCGPIAAPSLLDLVAEIARRALARCDYCAWHCAVDRTRAGKAGVCRLALESRVSAHFHHHGEEEVWRGRHGSGTVFFASCNMRCAFCQNGDISADRDNGEPVSPRTLATIAGLLRREGCHNVNWVGGEPTVHLHTILEAIALLPGLVPTDAELAAAAVTKADAVRPAAAGNDRPCGDELNAPMLWNSNFYHSERAARLLRLVMDAWLPDFKFGPGRCALALARTRCYWETVTGNLLRLREWDEEYTIRHLVMPGHLECCTVPVLDWIATHLPDAPVNIMDQYHPDQACLPGHPRFEERYRPLARRISRAEFEAALAHARRLGLRHAALSLERPRRLYAAF